MKIEKKILLEVGNCVSNSSFKKYKKKFNKRINLVVEDTTKALNILKDIYNPRKQVFYVGPIQAAIFIKDQLRGRRIK